MRRICVFCGSSPGSDPAFTAAARDLGAALAARGLGLVYGGAKVGLMGTVADASLVAGGEAVGVIPTSLVEREVAHDGLTELVIVGSLHERKLRMAELCDGFIALPGGMGTLDELFEVVTWSQLGLHAKPIGLVNVDGYFDPLLAYLERTVAKRFVRAEHLGLILVEESPVALLDAFAGHAPVTVDKWIDRDPTRG